LALSLDASQQHPELLIIPSGNTGIGIAPDNSLGISVAQFGSSAAGTMYFDTGGVFFRDETVFPTPRKRPETNGCISSGAASVIGAGMQR
jgi:hypothetical protein